MGPPRSRQLRRASGPPRSHQLRRASWPPPSQSGTDQETHVGAWFGSPLGQLTGSLTGRCHVVCSDCELGGMSRYRRSPSLPGYAGLGPGALGRGKEPQKWHPNVLGTALGRGSLSHLDAWEPSPPGFLPRFPIGMVGPGPGRQGLEQSSGQCGRLVWALRQGPWGPGRFWARPHLLQAPVFPSAIMMIRTPLLNPRVSLNLHCTEGRASL